MPETPAGADAAAITLHDVRKRYGALSVLDGLSLSVRPGEVYGFLGRNGAGKSTAIRLMMGISRADGGQLDVLGKDIRQATIAIRQQVGYVAQEQHFYPWMTPYSLGRFVRGFYPAWSQPRFERLLDDFGLPQKRKVGTFSGGMTAKMALSLALAGEPRLLILDEPTAGMDPVARREFLDIVRQRAEQEQVTVFFSTHVIDDIEAVADRIGIVEAGKIRYEGDLAALSGSIAGFSIVSNADVAATATSAEHLDARPGPFMDHAVAILQDIVRNGRRQLIVQFDGPVPVNAELNPGWRRDALSLEDIFVAYVSAGPSMTHRL